MAVGVGSRKWKCEVGTLSATSMLNRVELPLDDDDGDVVKAKHRAPVEVELQNAASEEAMDDVA